MRHKLSGGALILATLLLPAVAGADTVFWLDTPPDGATVAGLVEVSGWILDDGQDPADSTLGGAGAGEAAADSITSQSPDSADGSA